MKSLKSFAAIVLKLTDSSQRNDKKSLIVLAPEWIWSNLQACWGHEDVEAYIRVTLICDVF